MLDHWLPSRCLLTILLIPILTSALYILFRLRLPNLLYLLKQDRILIVSIQSPILPITLPLFFP